MIIVEILVILLLVVGPFKSKFYYADAYPLEPKQAAPDEPQKYPLVRRQQAFGAALGGMAAGAQFAGQNAWNGMQNIGNNLYNNLAALGYGAYNSLQNFGDSFQNGYYSTRNSLWNSAYAMPYRTQFDNPYSSIYQNPYLQMMPNMVLPMAYPQYPQFPMG
uniref:Uncharacterized protein n=1 Tax=Cacopsylla melanoneura TaxID=428564 RepID=A0A8D8RIY5_9HEMI